MLFMRLVNRIALPVEPPIELNMTTDLPVLICAVGIVVLSMLFCSLLPASNAAGCSITPSLKMEEPRHVHRKLTLRTLLLAGQITLSTVLLVTALLFVRNLARSQFDSPGFEVDRTMSVQLGFASRQAAADNLTLLAARDRTRRGDSWSRTCGVQWRGSPFDAQRLEQRR